MINSLGNAKASPVKELMNTHCKTIYPDDSLLTVIKAYDQTQLDTLPVVDRENNLVGVFPRKRLYRALLECKSMDDLCTPYIVYSPVVNYSEKLYDPLDMIARVLASRVGNVPVVDPSGKFVGMIGKLEYLREIIKLLTESHALLESIFQTMHEGIVVVDNAGNIIRANKSAENIFELPFSEIKGIHLQEILPEINFLKLNFDRKTCLSFRCTIGSNSVIVSALPIIENFKQIGINFAFRDISDIERIAQELEITKELQTTLSGVLNASTYGIFVTETTGVIKYVNQMAADLLHVPVAKLAGRPLEDFIPTCSPSQVALTGLAEIDVCFVAGQESVVSFIPIKGKDDGGKSLGVVSTVYYKENSFIEEIARKWFSLRQQVRYYRDELEKRGGETGSFDLIVSKNASFMKMKNEAKRIARSSSTVLITGESGVGKDMFARSIHAASPRAKLPFVKVNCAAIPETLLESELFGYASGSFTGASKKGKPGYFEQAHQGTIFLDEIGDMPLSIQVKILQVLQDKQFMRVGGTSPQKVDVRVIAATNRDLREAIAKGTFREDLFYRLNVIELHLPPLRARSEDILPLAEMFVDKYNHILGANVLGITGEVRAALERYNWPGNIRELENAIERAANYIWEGEIGIEHLPTHILNSDQEPHQATSYRTVLQDVDKEIILDALKATDGNKSAAARLLKISRSAFYEKLVKHGL